ncbi:PRCC domain containing protein [Asbolus verrucosus]|uniref:PRCC domain containing protein n=1 Tax=Asbolus verrucosus TaxID=1661398 RepID=A0A482VDU8_ASBVE|nr:PRCC domain containing protein [Asbolus verrucosus]
MWQKVCGRRSKPKEVIQPPEEVSDSKIINIAPEPVKPYDGLDNAAFKELVGKSKRPVNIKLIDINEEEILPDKNLWLTKSLTDPDSAPKAVIENPVDPTRKKKHHITYLAEQAKVNEQELQSQWSANKYTRNQTRAKYGF